MKTIPLPDSTHHYLVRKGPSLEIYLQWNEGYEEWWWVSRSHGPSCYPTIEKAEQARRACGVPEAQIIEEGFLVSWKVVQCEEPLLGVSANNPSVRPQQPVYIIRYIGPNSTHQGYVLEQGQDYPQGWDWSHPQFGNPATYFYTEMRAVQFCRDHDIVGLEIVRTDGFTESVMRQIPSES